MPEGGGNPGSRGGGVRVRRSPWGYRVLVAWVTGVCVACIGTYIVPDRKPIKFAKTTPPGRRQRVIRAHSVVN